MGVARPSHPLQWESPPRPCFGFVRDPVLFHINDETYKKLMKLMKLILYVIYKRDGSNQNDRVFQCSLQVFILYYHTEEKRETRRRVKCNLAYNKPQTLTEENVLVFTAVKYSQILRVFGNSQTCHTKSMKTRMQSNELRFCHLECDDPFCSVFPVLRKYVCQIFQCLFGMS